MSARSRNQVSRNRIQADLKDLPDGVIEALQRKARLAGGISVTSYIKALVIRDTIGTPTHAETTPFDITNEGQSVVHRVDAPWAK